MVRAKSMFSITCAELFVCTTGMGEQNVMDRICDDPTCWDVVNGWTYEDCCQPLSGSASECWDKEYTSERCCRGSLSDLPSPSSMFGSYCEYVMAQRSKTDKYLVNESNDYHWAPQQDIYFLGEHMKQILHLPFSNRFALVHGSRHGFEQLWFREVLPEVEVFGTEISPFAKAPFTIIMDFHEVKPEWHGRADFVYSNTLDHSYNATFAIQQWMKEVATEGFLILEHTKMHTKTYQAPNSNVDIFGATLEGYQKLIKEAGNYEVAELLESPTRTEKSAVFIFVKHKALLQKS